MTKSKVALAVNSLQGKAASIVGYCLSIIFFPSLIISFTFFAEPDLTFGETIGTIITLLLFCVFSSFMIIKGIQIKHRIARFKQYIALISVQQITALSSLAASTRKSVGFV